MWGVVNRWLEFPGKQQVKIDRVSEKGWLNEAEILSENAPAKIVITIATSPVVIMTIPIRLIRADEMIFRHLQKHAINALNGYIKSI
ncbi:MAG: hypothetical protein II178_10395 [Selenomonadaceae bacterium]|nr:hypothetical protein [Selenomonadaceae bacterium]